MVFRLSGHIVIVMRLLLFFALVLAFSGCLSQRVYVCPDGREVKDPGDCQRKEKISTLFGGLLDEGGPVSDKMSDSIMEYEDATSTTVEEDDEIESVMPETPTTLQEMPAADETSGVEDEPSAVLEYDGNIEGFDGPVSDEGDDFFNDTAGILLEELLEPECFVSADCGPQVNITVCNQNRVMLITYNPSCQRPGTEDARCVMIPREKILDTCSNPWYCRDARCQRY
jgi:hypothetical protein